jgi:hypothetical protein
VNVTVTGLGTGFPAPTGDVTFQVANNSGVWTDLGANVTLVNGHATSIWYTPLQAGNYHFRAIYNGDSNYAVSRADPVYRHL